MFLLATGAGECPESSGGSAASEWAGEAGTSSSAGPAGQDRGEWEGDADPQEVSCSVTLSGVDAPPLPLHLTWIDKSWQVNWQILHSNDLILDPHSHGSSLLLASPSFPIPPSSPVPSLILHLPFSLLLPHLPSSSIFPRSQEEVSTLKRKLEKYKSREWAATSDEVLLEEIKTYKVSWVLALILFLDLLVVVIPLGLVTFVLFLDLVVNSEVILTNWS